MTVDQSEIPIFPRDLARRWGHSRLDTINQKVKSGELPPFDLVISQKTRYWHRSTLEKAGVLPPLHPASASPPSPAAAAAVP